MLTWGANSVSGEGAPWRSTNRFLRSGAFVASDVPIFLGAPVDFANFEWPNLGLPLCRKCRREVIIALVLLLAKALLQQRHHGVYCDEVAVTEGQNRYAATQATPISRESGNELSWPRSHARPVSFNVRANRSRTGDRIRHTIRSFLQRGTDLQGSDASIIDATISRILQVLTQMKKQCADSYRAIWTEWIEEVRAAGPVSGELRPFLKGRFQNWRLRRAPFISSPTVPHGSGPGGGAGSEVIKNRIADINLIKNMKSSQEIVKEAGASDMPANDDPKKKFSQIRHTEPGYERTVSDTRFRLQLRSLLNLSKGQEQEVNSLSRDSPFLRTDRSKYRLKWTRNTEKHTRAKVMGGLASVYDGETCLGKEDESLKYATVSTPEGNQQRRAIYWQKAGLPFLEETNSNASRSPVKAATDVSATSHILDDSPPGGLVLPSGARLLTTARQSLQQDREVEDERITGPCMAIDACGRDVVVADDRYSMTGRLSRSAPDLRTSALVSRPGKHTDTLNFDDEDSAPDPCSQPLIVIPTSPVNSNATSSQRPSSISPNSSGARVASWKSLLGAMYPSVRDLSSLRRFGTRFEGGNTDQISAVGLSTMYHSPENRKGKQRHVPEPTRVNTADSSQLNPLLDSNQGKTTSKEISSKSELAQNDPVTGLPSAVTQRATGFLAQILPNLSLAHPTLLMANQCSACAVWLCPQAVCFCSFENECPPCTLARVRHIETVKRRCRNKDQRTRSLGLSEGLSDSSAVSDDEALGFVKHDQSRNTSSRERPQFQRDAHGRKFHRRSDVAGGPNIADSQPSRHVESSDAPGASSPSSDAVLTSFRSCADSDSGSNNNDFCPRLEPYVPSHVEPRQYIGPARYKETAKYNETGRGKRAGSSRSNRKEACQKSGLFESFLRTAVASRTHNYEAGTGQGGPKASFSSRWLPSLTSPIRNGGCGGFNISKNPSVRRFARLNCVTRQESNLPSSKRLSRRSSSGRKSSRTDFKRPFSRSRFTLNETRKLLRSASVSHSSSSIRHNSKMPDWEADLSVSPQHRTTPELAAPLEYQQKIGLKRRSQSLVNVKAVPLSLEANGGVSSIPFEWVCNVLPSMDATEFDNHLSHVSAAKRANNREPDFVLDYSKGCSVRDRAPYNGQKSHPWKHTNDHPKTAGGSILASGTEALGFSDGVVGLGAGDSLATVAADPSTDAGTYAVTGPDTMIGTVTDVGAKISRDIVTDPGTVTGSDTTSVPGMLTSGGTANVLAATDDAGAATDFGTADLSTSGTETPNGSGTASGAGPSNGLWKMTIPLLSEYLQVLSHSAHLSSSPKSCRSNRSGTAQSENNAKRFFHDPARYALGASNDRTTTMENSSPDSVLDEAVWTCLQAISTLAELPTHVRFLPSTHYVTFTHGIYGAARDFGRFKNYTIQRYPDIHCFVPDNYSTRALSGVAPLTELVRQFLIVERPRAPYGVGRLPTTPDLVRHLIVLYNVCIEKFSTEAKRRAPISTQHDELHIPRDSRIFASFIGHSLGGIIARSVVNLEDWLIPSTDITFKFGDYIAPTRTAPQTTDLSEKLLSFVNTRRDVNGTALHRLSAMSRAALEKSESTINHHGRWFANRLNDYDTLSRGGSLRRRNSCPTQPHGRAVDNRELSLVNFAAFASPHNGIFEDFGGLQAVSYLVPSGRDLATASAELQRLGHPEALLSLARFDSLTLYGNICNDYLVGPFTSLAIDPPRPPLLFATAPCGLVFPDCVRRVCEETPRQPVEISLEGFIVDKMVLGPKVARRRKRRLRAIRASENLPATQPRDYSVIHRDVKLFQDCCNPECVHFCRRHFDGALMNYNKAAAGPAGAQVVSQSPPIGSRNPTTPLHYARHFQCLPWRRFCVYIPSYFRAHGCIIWHGRLDVNHVGEPIVRHFVDEVFKHPMKVC